MPAEVKSSFLKHKHEQRAGKGRGAAAASGLGKGRGGSTPSTSEHGKVNAEGGDASVAGEGDKHQCGGGKEA